MLPFLKPKARDSGVIVVDHESAPAEEAPAEDQGDPGLTSAASDMMAAMEAKDVQGMVAALQAFIELSGSASPDITDGSEMPIDGMDVT